MLFSLQITNYWVTPEIWEVSSNVILALPPKLDIFCIKLTVVPNEEHINREWGLAGYFDVSSDYIKGMDNLYFSEVREKGHPYLWYILHLSFLPHWLSCAMKGCSPREEFIRHWIKSKSKYLLVWREIRAGFTCDLCYHFQICASFSQEATFNYFSYQNCVYMTAW